MDIESLLRVIAPLNRLVDEGVNRIRIPVEDNVYVPQPRLLLLGTAGRKRSRKHQRRSGRQNPLSESLLHLSFLLCFTSCSVSRLLRKRSALVSMRFASSVKSMAARLKSTIGAKTPAPSSCVIMRREK